MSLETLMAQLAQAPAKDAADDLRVLRDAFVKRAGRISTAELALFADLATGLLQQVALIERMAFARQLAKHRHTPSALLSLITHDHYLVSAPVLESAPLLNEEALTEVIDRFGPPVYLAIAKRGELSVQLTDRLMADADRKVLLTLAGNTGARLSRKSLTALCDLAETDATVRSALGRRRDLPMALASRLRTQGAPSPKVVVASEPPTQAEAGRGRAGIVLSADLMQAKPKSKDVRVIRYS